MECVRACVLQIWAQETSRGMFLFNQGPTKRQEFARKNGVHYKAGPAEPLEKETVHEDARGTFRKVHCQSRMVAGLLVRWERSKQAAADAVAGDQAGRTCGGAGPFPPNVFEGDDELEPVDADEDHDDDDDGARQDGGQSADMHAPLAYLWADQDYHASAVDGRRQKKSWSQTNQCHYTFENWILATVPKTDKAYKAVLALEKGEMAEPWGEKVLMAYCSWRMGEKGKEIELEGGKKVRSDDGPAPPPIKVRLRYRGIFL